MMNDPIVNKLNELENECYNIAGIAGNLVKIITHGNVDSRILIFYNFAQLVRSTKLYFILKTEYLNSREQFVEIYLKKWGQKWPSASNNGAVIIYNDNIEINYDYDQVIIVGYIQLLFSIVESRFRIFTICLDPTACKIGTDSFKNIYQWLLKKIDKQKYLAILEFFQLLRNTIHNNGVYRNIKEPFKQVTYRDKIFTFEHDKPVILENLNNLLFFELTSDLLNMIKDIIQSQQILKISNMEDPISK